MLVLIVYEVKNPERDYTQLNEAIKNCGSGWWHYLGPVWIIDTELSPNSCFERIREFFTDQDRCFIVDITQQSKQGWLPSKAWEWLRNHNS